MNASIRWGIGHRTVVALVALIGALALAPAALGSSLFGSVVLDPSSSVDLTGTGDVDWAVWGSAAGGTSTSLAPDVRKSGGTAISDLTNIDPAPSAPLRGIGQFAGPFLFSWSNGGSTVSGNDVPAGLQHNGGPPPDPLGADVSTLGKGFSFVGSQHHLEIGDQDFYVDLLFYHRRLRCLIAVDLKMGAFQPEHAGGVLVG